MIQRQAESISFCGQPVAVDQINLIRRITAEFGGLSRTELASTVCELLDWHRPTGKPKTVECRVFLEALHDGGQIHLPERQTRRPYGSKTVILDTGAGGLGAPVEGSLPDFRPLEIEPVLTASDNALWRELIQQHHYLGYRVPFGAHLRYFVRIGSPHPIRVGALQFSSPAWRMAERERWIGWSDEARRRNLQQIVCNSRFLIFPWVRIPNLASCALALAARRLSEDWMARYQVRPLLLETLVDPARFKGTCYQAANWIHVGQTTGRGRQDRAHQRHGSTPKTIFVYPLAAEARQLLSNGSAL
jgi:hypothetical protein